MFLPLVRMLLLVCLVLAVLPSLSDLLVVLLRLVRKPDGDTPAQALPPPNLVVLVPAHDEEQLVGRVVRSLRLADYPPERRRIVVVADNCTDETARIATDEGALCLVRDDPARPGKPQALAWAISRIAEWRDFDWASCIIVDADAVVESDFLRAIGCTPNLRSVIGQARNGVENPRESWLTVLADLLVRARYDILFQWKAQCGLNCPTAGNGTFIGRELLQGGWQSFSLAEGWDLYARTTLKGGRSAYVPGARVASQEARSMKQSASQRRRWSAGRWHVLREMGWRLLTEKNVWWLQRLDALCELANPGPVVHVVAVVVVALPLVLLSGVAIDGVAALLVLIGLLPYVLTYTLAIANHPEPANVGKALLRLPAYTLWRIPLGLRSLAVQATAKWEKTERH